jgi:hypothetical protein
LILDAKSRKAGLSYEIYYTTLIFKAKSRKAGLSYEIFYPPEPITGR